MSTYSQEDSTSQVAINPPSDNHRRNRTKKSISAIALVLLGIF